MNRHAFGGLCALALLGACGSQAEKTTVVDGDEAAVTVETAEGTTGIASATATAGGQSGNGAAAGVETGNEAAAGVETGNEAAAGVETGNGGSAGDTSALPAFAPLYPSAEIRTRVASASSAEGSGSLVAMRTADPFEKVVEFYDLKGQSAPGSAKIVTNEKDASVRIYGNEGSGEGALVSISRDVSGSGTVIVITAGTGRMAPKDEVEAAKVAASQGVRLQ